MENRHYFLIIISTMVLSGSNLFAQQNISPTTQRAIIVNGDTIPVVALRDVWVFPPYKFKNNKEEENYWRMVRDVKRTMPYAKMIYSTLIETYEFIETLPNDKARQAHLKRMEKELFDTYKPVLKKLTLRQGKLLIKLVDRECNQSSFELIKAFLGGFRASFWNTFASIFGASLKQEWDPNGKDKALERICILVENGYI
ncbi:MAG: DUF4294 domain-containing protein [Bacteroidales bacterium]